MGVKRPLEAEGLSEISFKQPKSIDYNKNLLNIEEFTSQASGTQKDYSPGVDNSRLDGSIDNLYIDALSPTVKELETSAELSNVTSSSSEQDAENEQVSLFHNFPPFIDFSIPWKPQAQYEDPYVHLLNSSPRKEIPIGPDYQAEVPELDSNSDVRDLTVDHVLGKEISAGPSHYSSKDDSGSKNPVHSEEEPSLMGTCIIPMPSSNDSDNNRLKVGSGRTECSCLDRGSTRCVQQHVKEAREKLKETLGDEIFTKLGFYEMGEEVSSRWSPDEEKTFHKVVYANPASHGINFWKVLSDVFPTRSKKEIVSYYFNVFMLWKRAVQNRSYTSHIDSDDDEDPEVTRGNNHQNKFVLDRETVDEEEFRNSHHEIYLIGDVDHDECHNHVLESFKDHDLDMGWVDSFETELLNGGEGDEGKGVTHETSEPQNPYLEKIIDHHDNAIDLHATVVGDDCNEDSVNADVERS